MSGKEDVDLVEYEEPPARRKGGTKGKNASTTDLANVNIGFVDDRGIPMYFTSQDGRSNVSHASISTMSDGSRVIVTPERQEAPLERTLKEKDLKFLKIFSVVAIILFFPTGIPALVYARRTYKAYYDGIERGCIDDAHKIAKTCERLIIMSLVCGLLTAVLIFALVEKSVMDQDDRNFKNFGRRTP